MPGGSILITSAPKSDNTVAAAGAAMKLAQSRTFKPSKMPPAIVRSSLLSVLFRAVEASLPCMPVVLIDNDGRCNGRFSGLRQRLFLARQQRRIAARGGRVDGHGLLGGEARQIMRPAGLGT